MGKLARWKRKQRENSAGWFTIDGILKTSEEDSVPEAILLGLQGTGIENIGIAYGLRFRAGDETFVVCAFPSLVGAEVKIGLLMFPMELKTKQPISGNANLVFQNSSQHLSHMIAKTFMDDVKSGKIKLET